MRSLQGSRSHTAASCLDQGQSHVCVVVHYAELSLAGCVDASSPAVTQYRVAATPKLAYMAPDMANMGLLMVVRRVPKMTIFEGDSMSASVPLTLFDRLHSSCATAWRLPICMLAAVKERPKCVLIRLLAGQTACWPDVAAMSKTSAALGAMVW